MQIAFISYEYPPDTAYGGIATYVRQAARMLRDRGHRVEVFTSSPLRSGTEDENGILVHRIQEVGRLEFSQHVGPAFAERHAIVGFDVLEGPEYFADAHEALRLVPDIPLVIKLHTPSFILWRTTYGQNRVMVVRHCLGAIRRGIKPAWHPYADFEYRHAREADEIAAPSQAIGDKLTKAWALDPRKVAHVPYPYIPSQELLDIPLDTCTGVVTFLGRLEPRKGVIDLARAIPLILRRHPEAKFRFVGKSVPSPKFNVGMQEYLELLLRDCCGAIEFTGPIALDSIPAMLAATDICVFPSIWESFGLVCAEAMAAGRGVVASRAGGMAELLDFGRVGQLVAPHKPQKIADAVTELLDAPARRIQLGREARERVLTEYNAEQIGRLQEASYARAIARRQALGPRKLDPDRREAARARSVRQEERKQT